jgi:hypothetical protein
MIPTSELRFVQSALPMLGALPGLGQVVDVAGFNRSVLRITTTYEDLDGRVQAVVVFRPHDALQPLRAMTATIGRSREDAFSIAMHAYLHEAGAVAEQQLPELARLQFAPRAGGAAG